MEFPLWKPLVFTNLSLFVGVLLPVTLFMNITAIIALVKSKVRHKPLLVLYGSLLLGVCVDKLLICVDQIVNSPSIIRYCNCLDVTLLALAIPRIYFIAYSVIVVTCQSVLQLLVIKGHQEWQSGYKRSVGCLILSTVIATVWSTMFFISNYLSEYPLHCRSFCADSPDSNTLARVDGSLFVVLAFIAFTLLPCVAVTVATSLWAFYIFKKKFIVRNNQRDIVFNRHILMLPVLMVFLLFCNSLLSYLVTIVTGEVLEKARLESFYGNWANYMSDLEYFILDLLHGLSYPLVLLYLYIHVRATWKKMLCCERGHSENGSEQFQKSELSPPVGELTPPQNSED